MADLPGAIFDVEGNVCCWQCLMNDVIQVIVPPTRDLPDVQKALDIHWQERQHSTDTKIGAGYTVCMRGSDGKLHAYLVPIEGQ